MSVTKREAVASLELYGVLSGQLDTTDCKHLGKRPQHRTHKPEAQLQSAIMRELGKHGAVFRTNSGIIKLPDGRVFRGLPEGFSDLLFIRDGRAHFIEVKVAPNKPTAAQVAFINRMQGLGCRAGVAYSVDDALMICRLSHDLPPSAIINKQKEFKNGNQKQRA